MNITDEVVERATEAIKDRARRGAIKYTNGKITVMDIDLARAALTAALGDVEHEEHEKHPPQCKHQWSPWRFRSRGGWVRECALCHQGELTFDTVVANATKGGDA